MNTGIRHRLINTFANNKFWCGCQTSQVRSTARQEFRNSKGVNEAKPNPFAIYQFAVDAGRQVLEVDSYGEEVSYEANCNENQT